MLGNCALHHPIMGLLITAGCDTAWDRTRVYSEASSTEMQGLDCCATWDPSCVGLTEQTGPHSRGLAGTLKIYNNCGIGGPSCHQGKVLQHHYITSCFILFS
jgi:hypothetical protein